MPAGPTLTVHLRPGLAAVSGVMSVLHARVVEVWELAYSTDQENALLRVGVVATPEQAGRVALQIDRRVDVLAVTVEDLSPVRAPCPSVGPIEQCSARSSVDRTKDRPEPAV